jgi:hypothetical protein
MPGRRAPSKSARRGDYRTLCTAGDRMRVVTVLAVAHLRDACRRSAVCDHRAIRRVSCSLPIVFCRAA